MADYLPVFDSAAGEAACMAAYQAVLDRWPVPYTECDVPTSFGLTHAIVSGADDKPPLVLMHALFASAGAWYRNVAGLSEHFKVYAVDVMGEANKSRPTRPIKTQDEMTVWFREFLDQTGIRQAYLVGNSYGAFMSAYYAMRLPERVRKLVLIGPAATFRQMMPFYWHMFIPKGIYLMLPWLPGRGEVMRGAVDWMHAGLPRDGAWDRLFEQFMIHGSMTTQIMPRVYRREELSQIQSPTLLLVGEHEKIYPPEAAIQAAKTLMSGITAKVIPNAHHIAALAQPGIVNRAIVNFCN